MQLKTLSEMPMSLGSYVYDMSEQMVEVVGTLQHTK